MRLYTVSNKQGQTIAWAGSMADAGHTKKALGGKSWQEQEVPTNKTELLAFLNKNAVVKNDEDE